MERREAHVFCNSANIGIRRILVIKYIYPDGSHCYRALHTTHAVFRNDEAKLIARAAKADGSLYEFEIKSFELLEAGKLYD